MGNANTTRQAAWQKKNKEQGLCIRCSAPRWDHGKQFCFQHTLLYAFDKRGIRGYVTRTKRSWNLFVNMMAARYEGILLDEGFAVDAVKEPERIVDAAGFSWAKTGKLRGKILDVIGKFDDHAIRKRFRG